MPKKPNPEVVAMREEVITDFLETIGTMLDDMGMNRKDLANLLDVRESRVSDIFRSTGNLTMDVVIGLAQSVDKKVALVVYDDGDPGNSTGIMPGGVFSYLLYGNEITANTLKKERAKR